MALDRSPALRLAMKVICRLKVFSPVFISGGHFVEGRRAILSILVAGHPRNISVKLLCN